MTLIVSWAGLDCKSKGQSPVASVYFAADSRYSWKSGYVNDYGQKVFGSISSPEIFALCGDVNFPKQTIQKALYEIDNHSFFEAIDEASQKFQRLQELIEQELSAYNKTLIVQDFHLFYATRTLDGFHVFRFDYDKEADKLSSKEVPIPTEHSDLVLCEGSGRADFLQRWKYYYLNPKNINHRTSRAVYHCFYETLSTTEEQTVGRIPQIVGLYRKFNGLFFGIVNDGRRYYLGQNGIREVAESELESLQGVRWHNERFEVTDPYTMQLKKGAQPQPFHEEANPFLSTPTKVK